MLYNFHIEDYVKRVSLPGQIFDRDASIIDRKPLPFSMMSRDPEVSFDHIDAGHRGSKTGDGLTEDAPTTTNIQDGQTAQRLFTLERGKVEMLENLSPYPQGSQLIHLVQWPERTIKIPPKRSHPLKSGGLFRVDRRSQGI